MPGTKSSALHPWPRLSWQESFAIGHDALDAEHKLILTAVNDLCAAWEGGTSPDQVAEPHRILNKLMESHLRHEDSVLCGLANGHSEHGHIKAMSSAALSEHMADHRVVLDQLAAILDRERSDANSSAYDRSCDVIAWFLEHIVKYDAHLKAIFQAM